MKEFFKSKKFLLTLVILMLLPLSASAQFSLVNSNFKTLIDYVLGIIFDLIPILYGLALIFFFWGLSKFILSSNNQADLEKGKNYMLWGVLALFILFSFESIISIITKELEFGNASNPTLLNTNGVTPKTSGRIINPGQINP